MRLAEGDANADQSVSSQPDEKELQARITEEFYKDPEVNDLLDELKEKKQHLEHARKVARQPHEPSRVAAQEEVNKVVTQYQEMWDRKYKQIRGRLLGLVAIGDDSARSESIAELRNKVAALKKKKEKQAAQLKVMQVEQKETNDDTFEATYLNYQISSLRWRGGPGQEKPRTTQVRGHSGPVSR